MPQPLPRNDFLETSDEGQAYATCQHIESLSAWGGGPSSSSAFTPTLCGRLLGYMILHAPHPNGRAALCQEILSCNEDLDRLRSLGSFYRDFFLRLFRRAKGPTPDPSTHPSRPSFDDVKETFQMLIQESPMTHRTAKKLALLRDDYRCVVTGMYDLHSAKVQSNPPSRDVELFATQAAHIFPDSTNQTLRHTGYEDPKVEYSASAWAAIERFGSVDVILEGLDGPGIHRLDNIMTLSIHVHDVFDSLGLWFEEVDWDNHPNQFRIRIPNDFDSRALHVPDGHIITLSSTSSQLPLPNRAYLRLHAACAKVTHLSGAAEYFDMVLDDAESRPVLASDGSSVDVWHWR
ncbi:hypothetical protein FRB99_008067 [Tulasnella sp. 403]|nr:hypothetical protein FRB99_008067 [Tulasnella sp. 403]